MNNLYCVTGESARLQLDVPEPVIIGSSFTADHQFLCTVVVTPGFSYRLEVSQDLLIWRNLGGTVEAYERVIHFSDANAPQTRRFYRVVRER